SFFSDRRRMRPLYMSTQWKRPSRSKHGPSRKQSCITMPPRASKRLWRASPVLRNAGCTEASTLFGITSGGAKKLIVPPGCCCLASPRRLSRRRVARWLDPLPFEQLGELSQDLLAVLPEIGRAAEPVGRDRAPRQAGGPDALAGTGRVLDLLQHAAMGHL